MRRIEVNTDTPKAHLLAACPAPEAQTTIIPISLPTSSHVNDCKTQSEVKMKKMEEERQSGGEEMLRQWKEEKKLAH
jgi:hypothetical protein